MKILDLTLEELQDYENNEEFYEDLMDDFVEISSPEFEPDTVVATAIAYRIKGEGMIAIEGEYCAYNEETGECEPDWGITLLYDDCDDEEFDPNNWLYFEQGTIWSALHNYRRA